MVCLVTQYKERESLYYLNYAFKMPNAQREPPCCPFTVKTMERPTVPNVYLIWLGLKHSLTIHHWCSSEQKNEILHLNCLLLNCPALGIEPCLNLACYARWNTSRLKRWTSCKRKYDGVSGARGLFCLVLYFLGEVWLNRIVCLTFTTPVQHTLQLTPLRPKSMINKPQLTFEQHQAE